MTVAEIMRKHVLTAAPGDLVDDVAAEMSDLHVGCVVVVEDDYPVGILTDRDISVRADANWADTREMTVRDVMTEDVFTADVDTSVLEISRLMADQGVHRIPIFEDDHLVGIVTQDDLIVLLSKEIQNLSTTVQAESPPEEWGRSY